MTEKNIEKSFRKALLKLGLCSAVIVGGVYALKLYQINNPLPKTEKAKIEYIKEYIPPSKKINNKYHAYLIAPQRTDNYTVEIRDTSKNLYLFGLDANKDSIIDYILIPNQFSDSTLKKLASVKELSKIEKELLEKQ